MTEKVGGIEYYIDANTSSIKAASADVESSSNKMVDSLDKVDKQQDKNNKSTEEATTKTKKETKAQVNAREVAARKIVRAQEKVAKAIKDQSEKSRKEAEKTAKVVAREAKYQADRSQKEAEQTSKVVAREAKEKAAAVEKALAREAMAQKKASEAAAKSAGVAGRRAGMAGIQIEQFVGSVQGGQDAMRAFSFQATDMGIVMGVPLVGAAIGLGAALLSVLVPSLMKSGESADELKEKLIELRDAGQLTADQAKFLANEEGKSQKERTKSIEKLKKEIKANQELNKSRESRSSTGQASGQAAQKAAARAIKETAEEIDQQKASLSLLNMEYSKGESKLAAYKLASNGVTAQTENQKEAIKSLISMLNDEAEATGKNERQILQLRLEKEKATDTDKAAALAAYDNLKVKQDEFKANKKAEELTKQQIKTMETVLTSYQKQVAQLELNSKANEEYNTRRRLGLADGEKIPPQIQAEIDALEALRIKKLEIAEQAKTDKVLEQEFKSIQTEQGKQGDPLKLLEENLLLEREIIKNHLALKLEDEALNEEQRAQLKKNAESLITDIEADASDKRKALADAEQSAKLSAMSGAFKSLSSLMNTESKKMFEIGKAAAIAGAIVDGIAAVQGAFKVGNKLGGPPLGAAYAAAAGVQAAVQIRGIAKQKIGGAQSMGATSSFSGGVPTTNTSGGGGDRNITVAGINPGDMFTGQQLIDTLRGIVGDGADISFLNGG